MLPQQRPTQMSFSPVRSAKSSLYALGRHFKTSKVCGMQSMSPALYFQGAAPPPSPPTWQRTEWDAQYCGRQGVGEKRERIRASTAHKHFAVPPLAGLIPGATVWLLVVLGTCRPTVQPLASGAAMVISCRAVMAHFLKSYTFSSLVSFLEASSLLLLPRRGFFIHVLRSLKSFLFSIGRGLI